MRLRRRSLDWKVTKSMAVASRCAWPRNVARAAAAIRVDGLRVVAGLVVVLLPHLLRPIVAVVADLKAATVVTLAVAATTVPAPPQAVAEVPRIAVGTPLVDLAVPLVDLAVPLVDPAVPLVDLAVPLVDPAVPLVDPAVPLVDPAVPLVGPVVLRAVAAVQAVLAVARAGRPLRNPKRTSGMSASVVRVPSVKRSLVRRSET